MPESTKPTLNEAECGNKSKPLLANRLYKFRAWDDKEKKWLLGYEYPNLGGFDMFGECMLFEEWSKLLSLFLFERNGYKNTDLKLMQFTGLYDKNKKLIYEGDILLDKQIDDIEDKDTYSYFQVLFDNATGQYVVDVSFSKNRESLVNITDYFDDTMEVVGNIFENARLLQDVL
jgi:uncharacterized phage protein (TIGR01671 family)